MFELVMAVCMVAPGPTTDERHGIEGVVMEDAKAFKIDKEQVRKNYYLARNHASDELRFAIQQNNSPDVVIHWEADCRYRLQCWDLLDDVVYCSLCEAKKLHSLLRLREQLGDADYFAGRMPPPTPPYRTPLK